MFLNCFKKIIKVSAMKNIFLNFIILVFCGICCVEQAYPQSSKIDSSYHPYYVNYWVTGPIIVVGGILNFATLHKNAAKLPITQVELDGLNRSIINSFDKISLRQDPSQKSYYTNLSDDLVAAITVLPGFLLFDEKIRHDWFDVMLIFAETMTITNNLYENSPMGPTNQNKFRPVVYYESLPFDVRANGDNRNTFYSGHTASVSAVTFFMAKVYSDYHPEMGAYKYLLFTAAVIPPLMEGYCRMRALYHFPSDILTGIFVGAVCGIIIPEFHRSSGRNISLGVYSSGYSTGVAVKWQPNFLK